jgi:hypothetical protein
VADERTLSALRRIRRTLLEMSVDKEAPPDVKARIE